MNLTLWLSFIGTVSLLALTPPLKGYLEDQEKVHWQNRIVGTLLILSGAMLSMGQRSSR